MHPLRERAPDLDNLATSVGRLPPGIQDGENNWAQGHSRETPGTEFDAGDWHSWPSSEWVINPAAQGRVLHPGLRARLRKGHEEPTSDIAVKSQCDELTL